MEEYKEEYKIGDQFYLYTQSYNYNESIDLVSLETINLKKVRGKDEHYGVYNFKYLNGNIESGFTKLQVNNSHHYLFLKIKEVNKFSNTYLKIYKIDNEFALNKVVELKKKSELNTGIKVLQDFISELKQSDNFDKLPKLNAVVKVVKHYE